MNPADDLTARIRQIAERARQRPRPPAPKPIPAQVVRLPLWPAELRTCPSYVLRSALFGVVFAAGWTPCVGPTLGAIIGMASLNDTFGQGTLLLVVFALGLGLPFVLVALGADAVRQRLAWLTNHQVIVSVVTGALLMVVGFLMLTNLFARLAQFTPQFPV